jgi:hypothetical protein
MNLEDIKENIYREDRAMAAVYAETPIEYVDMILSGRRNRDSKKGKKIMEKLEQLAKVNIASKAQKAKLIAA